MGGEASEGYLMSRQETAYRGSWAKLRKRVLDRDGWTCGWCGTDLKQRGVTASVDHVVSLKEGRRQGWSEEQLKSSDNLVAACGSCNSSRAERPGPPKRAARQEVSPTVVASPGGVDLPKGQKWRMSPSGR